MARRSRWTAGERAAFGRNLSAMMAQRGISNARLARCVGVSRQIVGKWREGGLSPTDDNLDAVCRTLQCDGDTLLCEVLPPPSLMPIGQWAQREGIPLQRAKDLFALKLLAGAQVTPFAVMVPIEIKAPPESKTKVLLAKRRPGWVPRFHANFPRLLSKRQLGPVRLGELLGIGGNAVSHWKTARNYPPEERLPEIARALDVPIEDLIGETRV